MLAAGSSVGINVTNVEASTVSEKETASKPRFRFMEGIGMEMCTNFERLRRHLCAHERLLVMKQYFVSMGGHEYV